MSARVKEAAAAVAYCVLAPIAAAVWVATTFGLRWLP